MNKKLEAYLKRRLPQPTVILCFRILLDNCIKNGLDAGMTKSEIAKKFNTDHKKFGIQKFKTDYILRQSGNNADSIFESKKMFFIDESFLNGLDNQALKDISKSINDRYLRVSEKHKKFYDEISQALKLGVDEKKKFILEMLMSRETDRKGQNFEVTAFAILKAFYSIRGFELNRFSTIYSNDGGIDYTSQTSIYQVTTQLSDSKFEEDILKAPLKKRIFVFRKAVVGFDFQKMENELVSDFINSDDLISHLDYLLLKKAEKNADLILEIIQEEFKREYYL